MEDCSHPMTGETAEQLYCLKMTETQHEEMGGLGNETPSLQSAKSNNQRKRQSQSGRTSESWMVAIVACLLHALLAGGIATTGVFMVELVEYFTAGKAEVSWIGALQLSLTGLGGIVIGGLVARFGSPKTVVLGALLVSGGQIAASFCNTIPALCVTLGFIVGLGISCWVISCLVAVQSYYVCRRSFASSVMSVGISFGVIIWPVWTEYLIRAFNWKGALLINSGVALHGIPLAMLLRLGLKGKFSRKTDMTEENSDANGTVLVRFETIKMASTKSASAVKSKDELALKVEAMKLEQAPLNLSNYNCCAPEPEDDDDDDDDDDDVFLPSPPQKDGVKTTKDIMNWEKSYGVPNCNQQLDDTKHNIDEQTEQEKDKTDSRSIYMELFHMPEVVLYILSTGCLQYGHVVTMIFIPVHAVSLGISKELAATLVSVFGILGPVGRLGSGYLGDVFSKHRVVMYMMAGTLTGTASILSSFAFNYACLVVFGIIFSIFSGCYVSFMSTVMTDLAGVKRLPQALSLLLPFVGIAMLVSVTTSGMLVDLTRSTAVAFIYCGSIQILGGILSAIIVFIQKKKRDKQTPVKENVTVT